MSEHKAKISWVRETPDFSYEGFDRTHTVTFGGGISLRASSAPEFSGKADQANPEEMLAAALASCHMLTFLAIASKSKLTVDTYQDEATAVLDKNEEGRLAVTQVLLKPRVSFSGERQPSPEIIQTLHEKAHKNCFIANSVKCRVHIEPA